MVGYSPNMGMEFDVGGAASTKMSNRTRKLPNTLIPEERYNYLDYHQSDNQHQGAGLYSNIDGYKK